ncbi:MAG: aminotransferase class I/II-fold pyridoxal phosphate-dependent enzyme, partial [Candidatus Latescibacteria bacterium]|nr:aminotransferase class I/II-fold pyridoxal phosphate-dependent enzyme [Candidatus Latescibacterota bacterium]
LVSLGDHAFIRSVVDQVAEGRCEYDALGRDLDLPTLPSATNFVAFDCGTPERAQHILDALIERGVFVRKPAVPPLDRLVRVTVGTLEERAIFAEAFTKVISQNR